MELREKFLRDFFNVCDEHGEKISIYCAYDSERTFGVTYSELNRVSNDLKRYFSQFLRGRVRYVAVEVSENFFLPCLILGIWKNEGAFVGIGKQYTSKDTLHLLNCLKVEFLITDNGESTLLKEYSQMSTFHLNQQKFYFCQRQLRDCQEINGSICYGIMTSGSTGLPKVIQVPWSCILLNVEELLEEFIVTPADCVFQSSPCSFDPYYIELFLVLLTGCSILTVQNTVKLCPSNLLEILFCTRNNYNLSMTSKSICKIEENHFLIIGDYVSRKPVTILQMTPSVFRRWNKNDIRDVILSRKTSLRYLILGGEKFPFDILLLKDCKNKTKIFNIYGITEVSCWAFINEIKNDFIGPNVSLGKPLKYITYRLNQDNELLIGSSARVCIINNEENLYDPLKTVYRNTGDQVHLINGDLFYWSRSNQIVKRLGMKINLEKIQEAFLNANGNISTCVCVFDDVQMKLALFYVRYNSDCSDFTLQSYEQFILSGCHYPTDALKGVERPDFLVEMSYLPLNSHGKCDKSVLMDHLKKLQDNSGTIANVKASFQAVWKEVLGLKTCDWNKSGFTELGGNSVLALQFVNKLEAMGLNVPTNFITALLNGESQEMCFNCLHSAKIKEVSPPRKRLKPNTSEESVKLSLRWKFNLDKCIDATPSIFHYLGCDRIVVGSHSSKLCCVASMTGAPFWTVSLGDRIESGVAVTKDGSRGFVGCYDRFVYCLSMTDGSVLWKLETGDMVKSTPCLSSDERVVFVASYDKSLYCLSVDTGLLLKRLQVSEKGIFSTAITSPSLNSLFLAGLDGTCLSLCQSSHMPNWKRKFKSPIFASPCLLDDERVVFTEVVGRVHCLNTVDGTEVWQYSVDNLVYSTPLYWSQEGITALIFGCNNGSVYCLNVTDRVELKWRQEMDSSVFGRTCLAVAEGDRLMVVAATTKGFVYLCNWTSGRVLTTLKLEGEVFSSPIFAENKLFVGCRDNNLYALDILYKSSGTESSGAG